MCFNQSWEISAREESQNVYPTRISLSHRCHVQSQLHISRY
jgi:hypothetical protein